MKNGKWLVNAWDLVEWLDNIDTENHLRLLRGKKEKFLNTQGIRHMLNTIPSVDAEEVVHGRWVDNCCSNCNTICTVNVNGKEIVVGMNSDYCPNCGAKMDGGKDND